MSKQKRHSRVSHILDSRLVCGLFFVLPAFVVVVVFMIVPAILSLRYSFTNWDGISQNYSFVGLDNFRSVLNDRAFSTLMFNSFYLIVLYVPVLNILALFFAITIYDIGRFGNFYKVVLFFPNIISMVVVGFIWRMIYNPSTGLLAYILRNIGLSHLIVDWLGQRNTVLPALSVSIIWFAMGFYVLIYLGGLSTVPTELYEAAEVDGIGWWKKIYYITIPMIAQSITINIILSTIAILTLFDLPYVLTQGGPGFASQTMALMVYHYAFRSLQPGRAMALAIILTVITMLIAVIELRFLRRKERY